ncbi:MAG TPA: glycoside hydrolase family 44 protein [Fibrobacteraceae bacterium]|nr:glycoside hydrolase family 44 protein [Fibrobacteraceae bacterium]
MKRMNPLTGVFLGALCVASVAEVTLQVDPSLGQKGISTGIYGKNHGISDDSTDPTDADSIALYQAAGVTIFRCTGGNNQTKYNWRKKITSHPDWFNNVYAHDWDYIAEQIQDDLPGVQGLFSLQLIGWAASSTENNFGDWNFYQENGFYPTYNDNLAGGGTVDEDGSILTEGDPSTYLEEWPADSTVGILEHWFGSGEEAQGLDTTLFRYWNMDNEPDIWSTTHDDVIDSTQPFEDFFAKYVAVAKAARTKWPGIQLVGPVLTNEWQWWNWENKPCTLNGSKVSPMEYFLYRIGQAEDSLGVKLLDVFDLHFYPGYSVDSTVGNLLQVHRVLYDSTYSWSGSNGIHSIDGNWGTAVANYPLLRVQNWMEHYLGTGRSRTAVTEIGTLDGNGDASVHSVVYASLLGTLADNGQELFTPWEWYDGWYEVLHLFTHYAKSVRVQSTSSLDSLVSSYASINEAGDSLTVILVNRDTSGAQSATVQLGNFSPSGNSATTLQLAGLDGETFVSETENALVSGTVSFSDGAFSLSLPKLSVTAVLLATDSAVVVRNQVSQSLATTSFHVVVLPHALDLQIPAQASATHARLYSPQGRIAAEWSVASGVTHTRLSLEDVASGRYVLQVPRVGQRSLMVMD